MYNADALAVRGTRCSGRVNVPCLSTDTGCKMLYIMELQIRDKSSTKVRTKLMIPPGTKLSTSSGIDLVILMTMKYTDLFIRN